MDKTLRQRGTRGVTSAIKWRTEDELWYLERLGLHTYETRLWPEKIEQTTTQERLEKIENYALTFDQRRRWGHVDCDIIKEYLDYELQRLRVDEGCQPFDMDIIDLLDYSNPIEDYFEDLTSTQQTYVQFSYPSHRH